MVACLERTDRNANFHEIVDFLTTSPIQYALTQIHATVDGKTVVISESSVRNDLYFNDEDEPYNDIYKTPVHTKKVFTNMKRKGKDFSGRITLLFTSMLAPPVVEGEGSGQPTEPQPAPSTTQPIIEEQIPTSVPIPNVADEVVFKEWDNRVVRVTTSAASLDAAQASRNITKTQSTAMSNDPLSQEIGSGGFTPGSDESRPDLYELMAICIKLSDRVLDLEKEKDAQAVEILKLKNRIKKLERKAKSSILPPKRRLYKQVDSSDDSLGEDNASKQGRNYSNKTKEFNISDKGSSGTEVFDDTTAAEKDVNADEPVSTAGDAVTAASVIPDIDTAGSSNVCIASPSTSTAGDIFED
ncbi:hypothetical protein Tco_1155440 [Tanacetum coccineum]